MDRVAAMTVIRGEGGCRATYDKMVSEEMQRLNARYAAKEAELCTVRRSRDRLLGERAIPAVRQENRIISAIETAWLWIWAIGLKLGMWEYAED